MSILTELQSSKTPEPPNDDEKSVAPVGKVRLVWTLNVRLLVASLIVTVLVAGSLAALYRWQSQRLTAAMLARADSSLARGDLEGEITWLSRFVRMKPDDAPAQIRLAKVAEAAAEQGASSERARTFLSRAITLINEKPAYGGESETLRRAYISRLLKIGGARCLEAEQLIITFNPPQSAESLKWMATAAFNKLLIAGRDRPRQFSATPMGSEPNAYWKWLAQQPLGYVLYRAMTENPDDVELRSYYLTVVTDFPSELNTPNVENTEPINFEEVTLKSLDSLAADLNSGKSQWTAYAFHTIRDPAHAESLIEAAYTDALARLNASKPDAAAGGSQAVPDRFDWLLVLTAARQRVNREEYEQALDLLRGLVSLISDTTNPGLVEQTFSELGRCYWQRQEPIEAVAAWRQGLDKVPTSLILARDWAKGVQAGGQVAEIEAAYQRFSSLVDKQTALLDGAQGSRLDRVERDALRRELQLARWQAITMSGHVSLLKGQLPEASQLLAQAFDSPLPVSVRDRVTCGRLLASSYSMRQAWDMAAQTLERCVGLEPNNKELRRSAADAWLMLGSNEQAGQQAELIDDGSFEAALEMARIAGIAEATKPVALQDLERVRSMIQLCRSRFAALNRTQQERSDVWRLELLELSIANAQAKASQDPGVKAQTLKQLASLVEKYPQSEPVQSFAAVNFALHKEVEQSQKALARLRGILNSGSTTDKAKLLNIEALVVETAGQSATALKMIEEAIGLYPDQAEVLSRLGAEIALRNREPLVALAMYKKVPEDKWDLATLLAVCQLGLDAPDVKKQVTDRDWERWERRLKELEGNDSSTWRYFAAMRSLTRGRTGTVSSDILSQAEAHHREIERLRPRWSKSSVLGGQIAALRGEHDRAINYLRQAIRLGDQRASTLVLLVSELMAADRPAEAETELKRLSSLPEGMVPVTQWSVAISQYKGELRQAVDIARNAAIKSPNDFKAWMIVYQAALTLSNSSLVNSTERDALRSEAWDALGRATELSQGKDVGVWNARIGHLIKEGNAAQAKAEVLEMERSIKSVAAKLVAALSLLQLGELETARVKAQEALALEPNNYQAHLAHAQVLQSLGETAAMIEEMEAALELNPTNSDLREKLAIAYVSSLDNVPWTKFDTVLSEEAIESSAQAKLLRATLSFQRGDAKRKEDGRAALEQLANTSSDVSVLAKRVLAQSGLRSWLAAPPADRQSSANTANFIRTKQLFDDLLRTKTPQVEDLVGACLLLIENKQYSEAETIANRLPASAYLTRLQLGLRLTKLRGGDVQETTSQWVDSVQGYQDADIWDLAGRTLLDLNLESESLTWLEKAYQKDPGKYWQYAIALARVGQSEKAIEVCLNRLKSDSSVEVYVVLMEVALVNPSTWQLPSVNQAAQHALEKYPESVALLEAAGTLRLMQSDYTAATELLKKAESFEPNRLRTLNNLAIALSQTTKQPEESLSRINRAIRIGGREPEILDTLALVQTQFGQWSEAQATMQEALRTVVDPRFQARLAHIKLGLGEKEGAKSLWESIDHGKLDMVTIPPVDKPMFQNLVATLGGRS